MKNNYSFLTLLAISILLVITSFAQSSPEQAMRFPVSLSYASTYWWRGIELNGRSVGVMWLGAGIEFGNSGFSANFNSAVSQDYLIQNDESKTGYDEYKNMQKAKSEFDYGLSYSKTIAEIFTIETSMYYVQYPFYEDDATITSDPSFIEASLAFGIKTILNPKLTVYYDYYVEETSASTPVNEDYYINLAITQPLYDADGFTFSLGAWAGYYNNAYLNAAGFSDAGISAGLGYSKGAGTFNSTLYYARSLTKDFQIEYEDAGVLKNHIWTEFEIIYKL